MECGTTKLKNYTCFCNRAEAEGVQSGERPAGEDDSHGKIIKTASYNRFKINLTSVVYVASKKFTLSQMHWKIQKTE